MKFPIYYYTIKIIIKNLTFYYVKINKDNPNNLVLIK